MSTLTDNQHNCKHCGQPRNRYAQKFSNGHAIMLSECYNADCDLHMITQDDETWETITETELARYTQYGVK